MTALNVDKPEWAMTARDHKRAARLAAGGKSRRLPIVLLLVAGIAGGITVWQVASGASSAQEEQVAVAVEPSEAVLRLAGVDVTTIAEQTLTRTVKVTGTLKPLRHAALAAQVGGPVAVVNYRPGDKVREGDVLVQLDTSDLEISLNQVRATMAATEAQLTLANQQLQSAQALADRGLTANSALDTAKSTAASTTAQLNALKAQVASAEAAIAKATIRAPFDGTVSSRSVEPNQNIAAGSAVMSIVDLSRMEVTATVPLAQATDIVPDQRVEFTAESNKNRVIVGTVDRINPLALDGTRSINVYATLDNGDGFLRGGMFVTGNVIVDAKEAAIAVPAAAIQSDGSQRYVLKITDGVVQRADVTVGAVWDREGTTEILSGLSVGDAIVNTALERLLPGARVQVAGLN